MSIQTEINRITQLRDEQTTLLSTQGVTINDIKQALQNKCTGTDPVLQEKTIAPSTSSQNVTPDNGYDGLSKVTVSAVTSAIDSDIKAANIKKGVNILGVTGTLEEGEDVTSELNTYETYLGTQETTIDNILTALQYKAGGSGELDALVTRTITRYSNNETFALSAYVFHNCSKLASVRLPNVTSLGTSTFNGCSSLTSIEIPKVTSITTQTFYGCHSLTSLDMPSLKTIGAQAVRNCAKLARVDIGVTTSIAALSFDSCPLLDTLIVRTSSVCSLGNVSAFNGTKIASGTGYVYVPDNLVSNYKSATNWSTYANQIKGISEL